MGEKRNACRVLVGRPEKRSHWKDIDVDGRTVLKWILDKEDEGLDWLRIGTSGGLLLTL
jgi:hypothetical protein